jgi:hypothetical protein
MFEIKILFLDLKIVWVQTVAAYVKFMCGFKLLQHMCHFQIHFVTDLQFP